MNNNPETFSHYFGDTIKDNGITYESKEQLKLARQLYTLVDQDPNLPIVSRYGAPTLELPHAMEEVFQNPEDSLADIFDSYTDAPLSYVASYILKRDRQSGEKHAYIDINTPLQRKHYQTREVSRGVKFLMATGLGDIKASDYYNMDRFNRDFKVQRQLLQLQAAIQMNLLVHMPTDESYKPAIVDHLYSHYNYDARHDATCSTQDLRDILLSRTHSAGVNYSRSQPHL